MEVKVANMTKNNVSEIAKTLEEHKEKIDNLELELEFLKLECEKLEKSHWVFNHDERKLGSLVISCNTGTWLETRKNRKKDKIFYLETDSDYSYSDSIEFNLEEAKMLVEYINEKIEFMES